MAPLLGGEVVERQQGVAILDETGDRVAVFDAIFFDEDVEALSQTLC